MNRGIYQNAILFDPATDASPTSVGAAEGLEPTLDCDSRRGLSFRLVHPGPRGRRQRAG